MAYVQSSKPTPPVIADVSGVWHRSAPPGIYFKAYTESYSDPDVGCGSSPKSYEAYIADTEQGAKEFSQDIMDVPTGSNVIPMSATTFANVDNGDMNPYTSEGFINFGYLPNCPKWFGKDLWLALRRKNGCGTSDITTSKFYYPHMDEPVCTVVDSFPIIYKPTTEPVLTRIWTCSSITRYPTVGAYDNNDSFQLGDIFIYFNSIDQIFHKVCYVLSFYDHAASRGGATLSGPNTPYNDSGVPIYISVENGDAYLYNPEIAGSLFSGDAPNIKPLLDNYTMLSYNFPTEGSKYVGIIGNITVTNTFDGLRFRLHDPSVLSVYKMFLHIFIDGHYANPESVLLGRGYSPATPQATNGFVLGDNVIRLSDLVGSTVTETAVRFSCSTGSSPRYWSATPSTKYTKGCPSEETSTC